MANPSSSARAPQAGTKTAALVLGTQATFKMLTLGETTSDASFFGVIVLAAQLGIGMLVAGRLFRRRRGRNAAPNLHRASASASAH